MLLSGAALRNEGGCALHAPDMSAGACFLARDGFSARGEIRLAGLRVEGDLNFWAAHLSNPGGNALLAYGIPDGRERLCWPTASALEGVVRLSRSRIGGAIFLHHAQLENPAADADPVPEHAGPDAARRAGGGGRRDRGLPESQFANIRDKGATWPRQLRLSGLGYDELVPPLPAPLRVAWLHRDVDGYLPRNYETLAAMYRNSGDDAGARQVLLARERERRAHLPWYGRGVVVAAGGHRRVRVPAAAAAGWLLAFSPPARWPSACTTRRRRPAFRILPSTASIDALGILP